MARRAEKQKINKNHWLFEVNVDLKSKIAINYHLILEELQFYIAFLTFRSLLLTIAEGIDLKSKIAIDWHLMLEDLLKSLGARPITILYPCFAIDKVKIMEILKFWHQNEFSILSILELLWASKSRQTKNYKEFIQFFV